MKGNLLEKLIKKCFISLLCLAMVMTTLTVSNLSVKAAGSLLNTTTVADKDTSGNWASFFGLSKVNGTYNNVTSYNNFIQKVGSVYVDKSVNTIAGSDDFNITFTALQSAFSYTSTKTTQGVGLDVVLVLDNSVSMTTNKGANGDSNLLETMVKAANNFIDKVVAVPNTRFAIVTYDMSSSIVLSFGEYKDVELTYSSS